MTIPPPALEIDGVSHRFGARVALDDLRFTLPAGRFTALLGVNGAGKTTLFNLICGLYGCGAGAIRICGHDIARTARPALAALGVVFQSRALDPELTVAENLRYAAALRGMARRAAAIRAEELMTRLDLQSRMKDRAGALSGGQFRHVEIAAALRRLGFVIVCFANRPELETIKNILL